MKDGEKILETKISRMIFAAVVTWFVINVGIHFLMIVAGSEESALSFWSRTLGIPGGLVLFHLLVTGIKNWIEKGR